MPRRPINRGTPLHCRSLEGKSTLDPLDPMLAMPSGELAQLAELAAPEAIRRLNAIGERFGKVESVLPLPKLADSNRNQATFLINFETGLDALRAAQSLHCPLYGYTTVIVSLPQLSGAPESQSRHSPLAEKRARAPISTAMNKHQATPSRYGTHPAIAQFPLPDPPNMSGQAMPDAQRSKQRGLLALDGQNLNRDILKAAQAHCLQLASRVDILLTNPPAAPTSVLYELLIGLEKAGVDYRLTVTEGSLPTLVSQYLRRFLGISVIMVAAWHSLGSDWRTKSAYYSQHGYQLVTLQESPQPGKAD